MGDFRRVGYLLTDDDFGVRICVSSLIREVVCVIIAKNVHRIPISNTGSKYKKYSTDAFINLNGTLKEVFSYHFLYQHDFVGFNNRPLAHLSHN